MSDQLLRPARADELGRPMMQVAIDRVGIRKAMRAMTAFGAWAYAESVLGHELGQGESVTAAVREHAEYWRQSERTSWRELQRFRDAFPEEESPSRLSQLVLRELAASEPAQGDFMAVRIAAA